METVSSYTNSNTITMVNFNQRTSSYPLSNIYDDDYDNYGQIIYSTANTDAKLKIGSPLLSSLGIPENAIITNVKLTDVSKRYYNSYYAPSVNKMYISINNTAYDESSYSSSSSIFATYIYDTGDISIIKSSINDDMIYFVFEWTYPYTSCTYTLKTLYWEITYEIGGSTYQIKVGEETIAKMYLGQNEVTNAYIGEIKI